jgi:protein-disulfide isomerase
MRKNAEDPRLISRRGLLTALSSSAFVAASASYTLSYVWSKPANAASWENPDDMAIGNPGAPVVVIEYFSLTCPHCWRFHRDTYAAFRRDFVETGKVRLILRDYPLNEPALRAAQLAHCGGKERYFPFVETLFQQFEKWTASDDYIAALAKIGELGGVSEAQFKACLADKELEARILAIALDGEKKYSVQSTPSFVVNGKLHEGEMQIGKISKIVNDSLPES